MAPSIKGSLKRSLKGSVKRKPAQPDLHRAGKILHDDVGPLLSAAGLHLQLLCLDFPGSQARIDQVFVILDEAMEKVRALSQELAPRSDKALSPKPSPPRKHNKKRA